MKNKIGIFSCLFAGLTISLGSILTISNDGTIKGFFDKFDKGPSYSGEVNTDTYAGTEKADYSFYSYESNTMVIDSAEKLLAFNEMASKGITFEGKTIKLAANINWNEKNWYPVENFAGTFDGDGHTISNMKIAPSLLNYAATQTVGFFGTINDVVTIKNTNFSNINANYDDRTYAAVGIVVGLNNSNGMKIINCDVTSSTSLGEHNLGSIIGESSGSLLIKDCDVYDTYVESNVNSGGIIGLASITDPLFKVQIDNVTFNNSILLNKSSSNIDYTSTTGLLSSSSEHLVVNGFSANLSNYQGAYEDWYNSIPEAAKTVIASYDSGIQSYIDLYTQYGMTEKAEQKKADLFMNNPFSKYRSIPETPLISNIDDSIRINGKEVYNDVSLNSNVHFVNEGISNIKMRYKDSVTSTIKVNGAIVDDFNTASNVIEVNLDSSYVNLVEIETYYNEELYQKYVFAGFEFEFKIDGVEVSQHEKFYGETEKAIYLKGLGTENIFTSPQITPQNLSVTLPTVDLNVISINGPETGDVDPDNYTFTCKKVVVLSDSIVDANEHELFYELKDTSFNVENNSFGISGITAKGTYTVTFYVLCDSDSSLTLDYSFTNKNSSGKTYKNDKITFYLNGSELHNVISSTVTGGQVFEGQYAFNLSRGFNEVTIEYYKGSTATYTAQASLSNFLLTETSNYSAPQVVLEEPINELPGNVINDIVYPWSYDSETNEFTSTSVNNRVPSRLLISYENSEVAYFKYKSTSGNIFNIYVNGEFVRSITSGTAGYVDFYHVFDEVGNHIVEVEFLKGSGQEAYIKDIESKTLSNYNLTINGIEYATELLNIHEFIDEALTSSVTCEGGKYIQLFATPIDGYVIKGYTIDGIPHSFDEVIQVSRDLTIDLIVEREFINTEEKADELQFSIVRDNDTYEKQVYPYETITLTEASAKNEITFTAPYINEGEVVHLYLNGANVGFTYIDEINGELIVLENMELYMGVHRLTLFDMSDFLRVNELEYVYMLNDEEVYRHSFTLVIDYDIGDLLIKDTPEPIVVTNEGYDYPFVYDPSFTHDGNAVYMSTNQGQTGSSSYFGLTVAGTGTIVFDYKVSSYGNSAYAEPEDRHGQGYGVYSTKDSVESDALYGTLGKFDNFLGDNVSYANGDTGWRTAEILINTETEADETTIYIVYTKVGGQLDDTVLPEQHLNDCMYVSNVRFVKGSSTINFAVSDKDSDGVGGNVTLNGSDANNVAVAKGTYSTLVANVEDGYKFYGWMSNGEIVSETLEYTFPVTSDAYDIVAVIERENTYYFRDGVQYFESLSEAVLGGVDTIYMVDNYTLVEDINIPASLTLILPFKLDDLTGYEIGSSTTGSNRVSWANEAQYLFRTLTINEGVNLTVNGKLVVGAVQHYPDQSAQGHTSGAYSQIINNGTITVNNEFKVHGLVKGEGSVIANDGSIVYQPFMVNDYAGGNNTYNLYSSGQFPFNQFATVNIQCNQTVNYGAKVVGMTSLYFWSAITTQDVVLIDKIENNVGIEGALIWMEEGSSIEISYDANKAIKQQVGMINLTDSGVTTMTFNGNVTAGEFYLQGFGSYIGYLALPYTYNFVIESGTFTIPEGYGYKIMPGAKVVVNEGATLNVLGSLLVYEGLVQNIKSNKYYPISNPNAGLTSDYGFDKTGMLVVNGTMSVDGVFAGIAQTNGTATITTSASSTLGLENVIDGSDGLYTNNITKFDLPARVYGLNGFVNLVANKTYKGYSNDSFTLDTFTAKEWWVGSNTSEHVNQGLETISLNQAMSGRILEYDTVNNKYIATVKHYIGEAVDGVQVNVNGKTYQTDENGMFTVTYSFTKENNTFAYYTIGKETSSNGHNVQLGLFEGEYMTLTEVVKSVELDLNNKYTIKETEQLDLNAIVTFYGGETLSLDLTTNELTGEYVYSNQTLNTTTSYVISNNNVTITIIPTAFDTYNEAVEALKDSDDIVAEAIELFEQYNSFLADRDSEDRTFAEGYLEVGYASTIVKELSLGQVTYGELEKSATATYVDGTTSSVTVETDKYIVSPALDVDFTYTGTHEGSEYVLTVKPTGIAQINVQVSIDDKTVSYGDEVELTASFTGTLVAGDSEDMIYSLSRQAGNVAGTYAITGEATHKGYNVVFTRNGTYTINKRQITVTINNQEVTYGEEADLTYVVTQGSIASSHNANNVFKLSCTQDGLVGEYPITGTTLDNNYVITFVNGTYTINKRQITVTINSQEVTYGEETDLTYTLSGALAYDHVEAAVFSLSREVGTNVGSYKISGTVLNDNYAVSFNNDATYTINAREITVTIDDKEVTYGEEADLTYTLSGALAYDHVEAAVFRISRSTGTNVGEYAITGTKLNNNYNVTFVDGVYTITHRQLTVTINNQEVTYGEEADLTYTLSGTLATGHKDADVFTLSREDNDNVGTYAITGKLLNNNYQVTFNENATYTILAREISVSIDNQEITYGDDEKELTYKVTGTLAQGQTDADVFAISRESGVNKGVYAISGEVLNNNYVVTFTQGATYTINAREITVTIDDQEVTYGDKEATLSYSLEGTLAFEHTDADVFKLSRDQGNTVGEYAITGQTLNNNYAVTFVDGTYKINVLDVELTVDFNKSLMQSSTTQIDSIYVTSSTTIDLGFTYTFNVMDGETLVATIDKDGKVTVLSGELLSVGKTYRIVIDANSITGNDNVNISTIEGSLTVKDDNEKYIVSIEAEGFSSKLEKVYDNVAVTPIISVELNEELIEQALSEIEYKVLVNGIEVDNQYELLNVGRYNFVVVVLDNGEEVEYDLSTYTILAREISVSIDNQEITYGEEDKELTYSLEGTLADGHDNEDVFALSRQIGNDAGNYIIDLEVLNENYNVSYNEDATYVIKQRELTVTIDNQEVVYGEEADLTYSVEGTLAFEHTDADVFAISRVENENTGTYAITGKLLNNNYNVTFVDGAYTITHRQLTVTINNQEVVYGEEADLTYTLSGALAFEQKDADVFTLSRGNNENVGTYAITGKLLNNNYQVTFNENATYTILAREISVSIDNQEITYGEDEKELTYKVTGTLAQGQTDADVFAISRVSGVNKGVYAISGEVLNNNYVVTFTQGATYTINAREITVTIDNQEVTYGEEADLTYKLSGELAFDHKDSDLFTINPITATTVGEYPITGEEKVNVISNNYDVTIISGVYKIVPREITVTIDNQEVIYGDVEKQLTYNLTGTLAYDHEDANVFTISRISGETVGEYAITGKAINNNYKVTFVDGVYTIEARVITVTIDDQEVTYGDAEKTLTYEVDGTLAYDHEDADVFTLSREVGKDAGTYAITLNKLNDNYEVLFVEASYVINPKALTITINDATSVYGNEQANLTYTFDQSLLVGNDNASNFITLTKQEGLNVGTYSIYGENTNANYAVTFVNEKDSYTITARALTVVINNKTVTYGDAEEELTSSISTGTLAYNDNAVDVYSIARESGIDAGTYAIDGTVLSDNYAVTFVKATYTINPRNVKVKVLNETSVYGDEFNDVIVEVVDGSMAYAESQYDLLTLSWAKQKQVGTYAITAVSKENPNYNLTISYTDVENSVYEITRRPVTITINNQSAENSDCYDSIISKVTSSVTAGNVIEGDNLNIQYQLVVGGVTLTKENFVDYFSGGTHTLSATYNNANYELTVIDGSLTVTKKLISVEGIVTEYVYNDGTAIVPFNWEENIVGLSQSANERTISYILYKKNAEGIYEEVTEMIDAGEYKIEIVIVHDHAYQWAADAELEHYITVTTKDISDKIEFVGVPSGNQGVYSELGSDVIPVLLGYDYVDVTGELFLNGVKVDRVLNVGTYTYKATINDANYVGSKEVSFTIVNKDLSDSIIIDTGSGDYLLLENYSINYSIENYDIDFKVVIVDLSTNQEVGAIKAVGNYKITLTITEPNYQGSKEVTVTVISSVEGKINSLEELTTKLNNSTNVENSLQTIEEMKALLATLTSDDYLQIEDNNEYKLVLENAEKAYDEFRLEVKEEAKEANKTFSAAQAIATASALASAAYMALRRKWRI